MTDQDVRDFLERMATEESVQFLDAEPLTRRAISWRQCSIPSAAASHSSPTRWRA
jgi:hypothetical protein